VFTSLKDDAHGGDTNNDGDGSAPAKGDWGTILVRSGATAAFDYVTIRYGGYGYNYCEHGWCSTWYGYYASIQAEGNTDTSVRHSTVSQSMNAGIWVNGDGASLTVTDGTISDNSTGTGKRYGIYNGSGSTSIINNSDIHNNYGYGLYNANTSITINAENNWWGSGSGPAPYGSGNGINYQTCWDSVNQVNYICKFYVDADPWVGKPYQTQAQLGHRGPTSRNQAFEAEPVNTANGNYAYQHTDLSIPTRGLPLDFARAYNSLDPQAGSLGYGWTHTWNLHLTENISDSTVIVTFGDGHAEKWTWNGAAYDGAPGVFGTLVKNGDGTFDLTQKDQTVYHFAADGKLAWAEDKNGNRTALSYDAQGRLTTVTEPAGRILSFAYTSPVSATLISQITDPAGRTIGFTYNITGELTVVTDTLGYTTTMTYDADHRLLTIADANAHTFVRNVYDAKGRVVEQYDALGNKWTFAYDEPNHKTLVTDPRGNTTTYQYDNEWRLSSEKDALNHTATYAYDADNNRTQIVSKRGYTTTMAYDDRGNPTVLTDTLGMTYDSRNNLLSKTDALGRTTSYTYDTHSNLIRQTDPLGHVTTWTYDSYGQMLSETDDLSHTTQYGYDAWGNQTAITDALGNATTFVYDIAGRKLSETDPLGHTTSYAYDAANRLTVLTNTLGYTTTYTYDPVGNRVRVTDALGRSTQYGYDAKDRLTTVTDPLGNTTTYGYDAVDNRISVTDPLSHTTTYAYDALNRRTSVTDPLGHTTTYTYDAGGNRTSVTDANGKTTTYTYDAMDRLTTVTDAAGGTVSYVYDAVGNRTAMTDANGHTTTWTYDALDRLASVTDPLGHTTTYTYDAVGNRTAKTKPDGTTITYTYDALNRLTATTYPGGSMTYAYDTLSRRTAMTDTTGTTTYTYDDLGRLTQAATPNGTLSYTYDAVGNRTGLTYPSGKVTTYTYDLDNRLVTVTDYASRTTTYTYDAAGRQTQIQYPNGAQAVYTYDNADRLISLVHSSTVSGTIASVTYTLDAVGNRLTMQDLEGTTSYNYDSLYRLTQVTYPNSEQVSYAYDAMGNRTAMTSTVSGGITYTYDAADRLLVSLSPGLPVTYTWDANGNMTGKGSATYTFDALDRLTQVVSGTTTVQFGYNGDGVRLSKTVNGVATSYVQDLAAGLSVVLAETTGGQTSRYVYGNGLVTRIDPAGTPSFFHADGLGSTRALSNLAGQRTDAYSYDVFGMERSHTGSSGQPFTFAGEQADGELGLVYLRARYYDPAVGRFIQRDRRGGVPSHPQSLNRYVYVQNNPTSLIDPSGESWWDATVGKAVNYVKNNVPKVVEYGTKIVNKVANWNIPTFPIKLWGAVESGKKTGKYMASLAPSEEDIQRRAERDCPGCPGNQDIARIEIMHEEAFQRSVLSLHETLKSIPLLGMGYTGVTYVTGFDSFVKQSWDKLTQRTRARSSEQPTTESAGGRTFIPGYDVGYSGGGGWGGPPSRGK
jgi:RHS repeat-associated protein